jgi:hypothetical protein
VNPPKATLRAESTLTAKRPTRSRPLNCARLVEPFRLWSRCGGSGKQGGSKQRSHILPTYGRESALNNKNKCPIHNTQLWQQGGNSLNSPKLQLPQLRVHRGGRSNIHGAPQDREACGMKRTGGGCAANSLQRQSERRQSPRGTRRLAVDECPHPGMCFRRMNHRGAPACNRPVRGPVSNLSAGPGWLCDRIAASRRPLHGPSSGPDTVCASRP